jgi:Ser/Thr protein kinase RdoA (MazF antagonist)
VPPEPGSEALYRVATADGDFLLTQHRADRSARDLERAADAAIFLAARNFPTPTYTLTRHGTLALDSAGVLYTLRPWGSGAPIERARLDAERMTLLGSTLGRLHTVLAELPKRDVVAWPRTVGGAIQRIDSAIQSIAARQEPTDAEVLTTLAENRALLQDAPDLAARFGSHRSQTIHGDYHVDNLIVGANAELAAVIDLGIEPGFPVWELFYAI